MWASMTQSPLALAALVLALAVGLGFVFGPRLIGEEPPPTPSPSPIPSPSRSPDPSAVFETVTFAGAGFTIDLPNTWQSRTTEDATHALVTGPGGGISVRFSDENGQILTCLPLPGCQPVLAASVADLVDIVTGEYRQEWGISASPRVSEEPVALDGVAATRLTVQPPQGMSGPGTHRYILLIRDGRALILEWVPRFSGGELWEQILLSLRFVDPLGPGTITSAGPLALYTNTEDGYEIILPQAWIDSAAPIWFQGNSYPGVRRFGEDGADNGYQALTISIGQPHGLVFAGCEVAFCNEVAVGDLDDLGAALETTPETFRRVFGLEDYRGDLTLGGEQGRYEEAGIRHNGLGLPWAMYHAFTIHDGRPVVLAFDLWNIRFNRLAPDSQEIVERMIASFRFLSGVE